MEHTLIQKASQIVVGIECRTSNVSSAGPLDIPRLWSQFFSENIGGRIPNKLSDEIFALYCDYETDYRGSYSLIIGCKVDRVDQIPEGMVSKVIPASSFAVFKAAGAYPQALIDAWEAIWKADLKRSYTGDYEFYEADFFSKSLKEVDVYIAL